MLHFLTASLHCDTRSSALLNLYPTLICIIDRAEGVVAPQSINMRPIAIDQRHCPDGPYLLTLGTNAQNLFGQQEGKAVESNGQDRHVPPLLPFLSHLVTTAG